MEASGKLLATKRNLTVKIIAASFLTGIMHFEQK